MKKTLAEALIDAFSEISDQYTEDEWRELTKPWWPTDYTDKEFKEDWQAFLRHKHKRHLN